MSDYLGMLTAFAHELAAGLIVVMVAVLLSLVLRRLINTLRDSKHLAPVYGRTIA